MNRDSSHRVLPTFTIAKLCAGVYLQTANIPPTTHRATDYRRHRSRIPLAHHGCCYARIIEMPASTAFLLVRIPIAAAQRCSAV